MIIFWIFTLFVGASTLAFTFIFLQLGLGWSTADALVAMVFCVGLRLPTAADPYPDEMAAVPDRPLSVAESA